MIVGWDEYSHLLDRWFWFMRHGWAGTPHIWPCITFTTYYWISISFRHFFWSGLDISFACPIPYFMFPCEIPQDMCISFHSTVWLRRTGMTWNVLRLGIKVCVYGTSIKSQPPTADFSSARREYNMFMGRCELSSHPHPFHWTNMLVEKCVEATKVQLLHQSVGLFATQIRNGRLIHTQIIPINL